MKPPPCLGVTGLCMFLHANLCGLTSVYAVISQGTSTTGFL